MNAFAEVLPRVDRRVPYSGVPDETRDLEITDDEEACEEPGDDDFSKISKMTSSDIERRVHAVDRLYIALHSCTTWSLFCLVRSM